MTQSAKATNFPQISTRKQLESWQLSQLNRLVANVIDRPFYSQFFGDELVARFRCEKLESVKDLCRLPLLQKTDLVQTDPNKPAAIFDLPIDQYSRLHQTSGTSGFPLAVLDTPQDWKWWLDCWDRVLDVAKVTPQDVALMAFSFGPFIGFWTANDALVRRNVLVIPSGGLSSESRLRMVFQHGCTIVCCTPTYALHLAEVAKKLDIDLVASTVSRIVVAGEPGGSIPSVRCRIESAWGADVIDHAGGSEIGAWGFGNEAGTGLFVNEYEFIAETMVFDKNDPNGRNANEGEQAELVLTSLGRTGGPVIRYRTGDRVQPVWPDAQSDQLLFLDGGVLGRTDDMVVIRGVNIFPSSIEAVVRELDGQAEFRIHLRRENEMDQIAVELEGDQDLADRLSERLRERLAMRVEVKKVNVGTLSRFEAKAKRVEDHR